VREEYVGCHFAVAFVAFHFFHCFLSSFLFFLVLW
jgi:hypothetical protein